MAWKLSNFSSSTLRQSLALAATTAYIDATEVDTLPTLGVGDKAKGVLFNSTYREIVNITAWDTNGTLTIERGREGTAARDWEAGTKFIHTPTAEILQAVLDATVQPVYRGTATGTNAITVTTTGSTPTPSDGDEITFEVANTNTSTVTLTYTNGTSTIGPLALEHQTGEPLAPGELVAGWRVKAIYDASLNKFILFGQGSKNFDIGSVNLGSLDVGNFLPNGGFYAWNNGTSFSTPATGTETADNVKVEYDGTIGAFSASRQTFTLGQTDVVGGPKYYYRWDQSSAGSGSTYRRIRIKVPNVGKYAGEKVIASAYLKADSARTVNVNLIQHFGTGGLPSAEVNAATEAWAVTTSWTRFDVSATLASVAGKTLGGNNDDGLIFEFSLPVNTSMTIDIAMAVVEFGDVITRAHDKLPWRWDQGGVGGSFVDVDDFVAYIDDKINTAVMVFNPDLTAIEALAGTDGLLAKTAANTWALRNLAVGTGLTVTNPAGIAGNPTVGLGTALTDYNADPMSIAELASITGAFGTAAFKNTGTSGNTVPLLDGANTFSAAQGISLTAAGTALTLTSTDAGASSGPDIVLDRNSASPAASDSLSSVFFRGRDNGGNATDFASIVPSILDPTNTSEDGQVSIFAQLAGTNTEHVRIGTGQVAVRGGSNSVPGLASYGDADTGLSWVTTNQLDVSTGGALRWHFRSDGHLWSDNSSCLGTGDGTVGLPGFHFASDFDTGIRRVGSNNQAIVLGGADYVDLTTARTRFLHPAVYSTFYAPVGTKDLGFRGAPLIGDAASNSAITFALIDSGCTAYHDEVTARTWTIPANSSVAFPTGTVIIIDNTGNSGAAGTITLSITTDTLRRGDGVAGTGSRNIAAGQVAAIRKTKSTEWVITGAFT